MRGTVRWQARPSCISRGILITLLVWPAPVFGLDLLSAYRLARHHDPRLAAARAAYHAVLAQVPAARARLLPQLAVTGSDEWTRAETAFQDPLLGPSQVNRTVDAWTWSVQLTQPLWSLPPFFAYGAAQAQAEAATARYAQAQEDLIVRVAQAYFGVLIARARLRATDAERRALHAQARRARHGYAKGVDAVTDVDEAQAAWGEAQAQAISARYAWRRARATLRALIGRVAPLHLAALDGQIVLPTPLPDERRDWIAEATWRGPAVRAAQAAVKAANWRVDEAKAKYAPSLALIASYGANASSGSLTTPENYALQARAWAAGVQLRMPIFTGGATYAGTQIATDRDQQAMADLRRARKKARLAARVAYDGIWAERAQARAWGLAAAAAAKALTGAQIGYRLGTRTDLDVLTALRTLYRAKRRYAQARYRMLLAGLALKAAVGALAETDIRGINALLTGSSTSPRAPRPHHG